MKLVLLNRLFFSCLSWSDRQNNMRLQSRALFIYKSIQKVPFFRLNINTTGTVAMPRTGLRTVISYISQNIFSRIHSR